MRLIVKLIILGIIILNNGCATFSTPISEKYCKEVVKNTDAEKVNVFFLFKHLEQTKGIDALPKFTRPQDNFNEIFRNSVNEISNIKKSSSITIGSNDMNDTQKREKIQRLKKENDYTVEMSFKKEKSFVKFFFGVIASSISATIIPIRYQYKYSVEVNLYNNKQQLINTYTRESYLNKWVQTFMVFIYPFHHEKRKIEEFYVKSMHNVFKQIEAEKILEYDIEGENSRTIYCIKEISKIIEKYLPADVRSWDNLALNSWTEKKDIAIIVHFPDDGLSKTMANQAFKMDLNALDKETNEKGLLCWIDKEEKHPVLLISARNESVLMSQLENNNQLKVLLKGMFNL